MKTKGWFFITTVIALYVVETNSNFELAFAQTNESVVREIPDQAAMEKVLSRYSMIQKSLVEESLAQINDDAALLLSSARKLKDKKVSSEIQAAARSLSSNTGMGHPSFSQAREGFKKLSNPIVKWVKKNKPEGWSVVYCSMLDASWVQKKDQKIQNPYAGKEMQSCGEKKES